MNYNKLVALDIGDVRIGIAASESGLVYPVETYTRTKSIKADIRYIVEKILEIGPERVIIGKPYNGEDTTQIDKNNEVVERLSRRLSMPFDFVNEACTSISAESELIGLDISRKKRKKVIDQLAAVIILESYLSEIKN